jgi:hypothetical protein
MAELDWRNQSTSGSQGQWGTTGTLGSQGLYTPVAPPRRSQAQGIQGTDDRAYTRQVTGDELVENRLRGLTNRNDLYMQNAARRGMQTVARRGMGLSSIAAGAAERSALEAAMPIASADAATFGRTQAENMEALNRGLMQERDIQNQQTIEGSRLAQAGSDTAMRERIAMLGFDVDLQRQREDLAFRGEQQGLDRSQQQWRDQFALGADLTRGQLGFNFDRQLMADRFGWDQASADAAQRRNMDYDNFSRRNSFIDTLALMGLTDPQEFSRDVLEGYLDYFTGSGSWFGSGTSAGRTSQLAGRFGFRPSGRGGP